MKKISFAAAFAALLAGCGIQGQSIGSAGVDVDLTKLNSTMVYSEVYNMMYEPENYIGKTIKMAGSLNKFSGEEDKMYYACIVADATACCQSGIEFEWEGEHAASDYPEENSLITVVGIFDSYSEGERTYYHLRNAKMKF